MRFRCPQCRKILFASTAVVMCACGMLAHAPTHLDDEPPARSPVYAEQMPPNILLGSGAVNPLPPGRQLMDFQPQRRYEIDTWQPPNVALALLALQRRLPVVVEGTWRSEFEVVSRGRFG